MNHQYILVVKNLSASAEDIGHTGSIPGSGRSPGGSQEYWNPLQYSFLENPHRQRSLVSYRPWCPTESDMTEAT